MGAMGVWFHLGLFVHEAFLRTTAAGVAMVMDACPAIEWARRGG
jgi:predicted CoA-binding protein